MCPQVDESQKLMVSKVKEQLYDKDVKLVLVFDTGNELINVGHEKFDGMENNILDIDINEYKTCEHSLKHPLFEIVTESYNFILIGNLKGMKVFK